MELIDGAIILDGLEDCLLGVTHDGLNAYSYTNFIKHFMNDGMTEEEAVDWVDFNVFGILPNGKGFVVIYE